MHPPSPSAAEVRAGDRRALARAITRAESHRDDHRREAETLLDSLLPHTGNALRIGLSGPPGAGKSTLIEALGLHLLTENPDHRLAVLAVDPSSGCSGGSILGDKTRMGELSRHPRVFIRPSPSGGTLGGVARRTRDSLLLCEAAGFDVILIETVGVGQSEVTVSELVDLFCLLVSPGSGDDLQGIKRGAMELADLVVVTKADGDLQAAASRTAADHENALRLLRPRRVAWTPQVLTCSAHHGDGIVEIWMAMLEFDDVIGSSGEREHMRARQAVASLWTELRDALLESFRCDPAVGAELGAIEADVADRRRSVSSAARHLLERFGHQLGPPEP